MYIIKENWYDIIESMPVKLNAMCVEGTRVMSECVCVYAEAQTAS